MPQTLVSCNLIPGIGYSIVLEAIVSILDYDGPIIGSDGMVIAFFASDMVWIQGLT